MKILQTLEPAIYDENADAMPEQEMMFHVCRLLRCTKNTLLPTETHSVPATVEKLAEACKQHYQSLGNENRPQNLQEMRDGYYSKGACGKTISCALDSAMPKKTLDFEYAADLEIENPLDIMTEVKVTAKGRVSNVDSICEEFAAMDTVQNIPQTEVDWKGELIGEKKNKPATPVFVQGF